MDISDLTQPTRPTHTNQQVKMFSGTAYEEVQQLVQRWTEVHPINPRVELRIRNTTRIMDTLVELPPLPAEVKTLWLENLPMLKTLGKDALPAGLKKLHIINCPALPTEVFASLPAGVERLDLRNVNLPDLSVLPKGVQWLHVDLPNLVTIPEGFHSLTNLSIYRARDMETLHVPSTVTHLTLEWLPALKKLPELPSGLYHITIRNAEALTELPDLPLTLSYLVLCQTGVRTLPALPKWISLSLSCNKLPAELLPHVPFPDANQMVEWVASINTWVRTQTLRRNQERCGMVKRELMLRAFAPERVARWLGEGTEAEWVVVDMMMGVE